jgi:hypothetical protein
LGWLQVKGQKGLERVGKGNFSSSSNIKKGLKH